MNLTDLFLTPLFALLLATLDESATASSWF